MPFYLFFSLHKHFFVSHCTFRHFGSELSQPLGVFGIDSGPLWRTVSETSSWIEVCGSFSGGVLVLGTGREEFGGIIPQRCRFQAFLTNRYIAYVKGGVASGPQSMV
jgi:hypothetical protein